MNSLYYWAIGALALYVAARTLVILKRHIVLAAATSVFMAAAGLAHPFLMAAGLTRPWEGTMHTALLVSGFAFTFSVFFALLLLIRDIIWLAAKLFSLLRRRMRRHFELSLREPRDWNTPVYSALALLALIGTVIGTWEAQRAPLLREVEITLPRLPQALDGVRIVQLTDLHMSPLFSHERSAEIFKRAAALSPDFFVVTGDLADGTPEARKKDAELFTLLPKTAPVFMIPGNHDYYVDFAGWKAFYEKAEVPLLVNAHETLALRGLPVTIAGLADRTGETKGFPGPDIEKALTGAAPDALRIVLMHRPENPNPQADPRHGVDLQLSGHTHAAQLFFMRPFVSLQNHGNVYGLYKCREMPLYVGSGTGLWSGTPARLLARPEIVVITLRAASAGSAAVKAAD